MATEHEHKAEALEALRRGETYEWTAAEYGICHNTLRGWASKAGLTSRGKAGLVRDLPLPDEDGKVTESVTLTQSNQGCVTQHTATGAPAIVRALDDRGSAGSNPALGSNLLHQQDIATTLRLHAEYYRRVDENAGVVPRRKPTHLVIPDTQCKPGENLDHLLWAGRYIAERKPDVVVHLGDHWDMPSLSSYEKRGSKWFEGRRILEDIEAGNRGLDLLMEGMGAFRPKRMVLLRGNHEDRITRFLNENPQQEGLVGFHQFNDVDVHDWEAIDFNVPITIDGVTYSHFFYNPNTGRSYSGAIETMLRNIGFTFTMGHQQGLRWGRRELVNGQAQIGLVAGSYYQHNEEYRGPQARSEWRGLVVKHEVSAEGYDPMFVSLDFLKERFSG